MENNNISVNKSRKPYKAFYLRNLRTIPQMSALPEKLIHEIEVAAHVFPFKTNNYVIDYLINWDNVPNDPIFRLNFPMRDMLTEDDFDSLDSLMGKSESKELLKKKTYDIRMALNPHPAGQLLLNRPVLDGRPVEGIQHKYKETVLFFPSQGQTCHAYCTFCFRWPQFSHMEGMKIAATESDILVKYLRQHPEATNVLFTGGDPLVMNASLLRRYLEPLLEEAFAHIHTIRLGTKALAYWPYRFTHDADAEDLLQLFRDVRSAGKHLAIMGHFNHYAELMPRAVNKAIKALLGTGAAIRTQSPLLRHINDDPEIWIKMWRKQISLGCIPYYMFIARDTGASAYFEVTLEKAYELYRDAYSRISGIGRTVRGPSMSATPGKVHVLGITEAGGEKCFVLQFLQGRNSGWVRRPFFARFDPDATWLSDLKPAFGEEKFFWQESNTPVDETECLHVEEDLGD